MHMLFEPSSIVQGVHEILQVQDQIFCISAIYNVMYIMHYVFFASLFAIVFIAYVLGFFSLSANVLVFVHPFCTGCLLLLCFVRLWLIHERFSHLGAADCGDNFVFPSPLFSCLIRL